MREARRIVWIFTLPCLLGACSGAPPKQAEVATNPVELGRHLVIVEGCGDCHTPMKFTSEGPEPDSTRLLSGHPESPEIPPPPVLPAGPWFAVTTMTAWSGPWGVSYAANLTPDDETGLGVWTEDMFVQTIRTGSHLGTGRPILPPMPWQNLAHLSDTELKAIYAYLRTIPAVKNHVPDPTPPHHG